LLARIARQTLSRSCFVTRSALARNAGAETSMLLRSPEPAASGIAGFTATARSHRGRSVHAPSIRRTRPREPWLQSMKKLLAVLVAALGLCIALWFTLRERSSARSEEALQAAQATAEPATSSLAASHDVGTRAAEPVATEPVPPASPQTSIAAPASLPPPAQDARGELLVTVLDAHTEQGIAGASILPVVMRTKARPGSAFGWSEKVEATRTDAEGDARVAFPAWIGDTGVIDMVGLRVSHPDYPTFEDQGLAIEGLHPHLVIRLTRGAFVTVAGFIGSRESIVPHVDAFLSHEARMEPSSWMRSPDGRPCSGSIPPGEHALWIQHRDA